MYYNVTLRRVRAIIIAVEKQNGRQSSPHNRPWRPRGGVKV